MIKEIKRYYCLLRRVYEIVSVEYLELRDKEQLQIAIKAVNNTAKLNSLVLTLLVFRAYLRLIELDPLNPLVKQ